MRQSLFDDEHKIETLDTLNISSKLLKIKYEDIVFSPLTQLLCSNCGMWGRTFRCPPYTKKYNHTKEYLKHFNNFILIIAESTPEEYERRYSEMKLKCGNLGEYRLQNLVGTQINAKNIGSTRDSFKVVLKYIRTKYEKFAAYEVGGGCLRCRKCNLHQHKPCAFPNDSFASCEGSGIDVYFTLKNIGFNTESPPIKKYFSLAMICYKD